MLLYYSDLYSWYLRVIAAAHTLYNVFFFSDSHTLKLKELATLQADAWHKYCLKMSFMQLTLLVIAVVSGKHHQYYYKDNWF